MEDCPDGGGADPIAEAGELAVDASVSPGRVLGGQADSEGAEAGGDRGSAGSGGLGGPVARNESLVPAQNRRGRDEEPESAAGREQAGQCGDEGSVGQLIRGRGLRRCSTASWWRRTRISISLAVSDRVRSIIQLRSLENTR